MYPDNTFTYFSSVQSHFCTATFLPRHLLHAIFREKIIPEAPANVVIDSLSEWI